MPKTDKSRPVSLACEVCGSRNYKTHVKDGAPLELKKFCKPCRVHTVHRSVK